MLQFKKHLIIDNEKKFLSVKAVENQKGEGQES